MSYSRLCYAHDFTCLVAHCMCFPSDRNGAYVCANRLGQISRTNQSRLINIARQMQRKLEFLPCLLVKGCLCRHTLATKASESSVYLRGRWLSPVLLVVMDTQSAGPNFEQRPFLSTILQLLGSPCQHKTGRVWMDHFSLGTQQTKKDKGCC